MTVLGKRSGTKGFILGLIAALALASLGGAALAAATAVITADGVTKDNDTTIETDVDEQIGMLSLNGGTVINKTSGEIITSGWLGHGMEAWGNNSKAENSGSITTSGGNAFGMFAGDNGTAENRESIVTQGSKSFGMTSDGSLGSATNYGSIHTSSSDAHGMWATGGSTIINENEGFIGTSGTGAWGMAALESNVLGTSEKVPLIRTLT